MNNTSEPAKREQETTKLYQKHFGGPNGVKGLAQAIDALRTFVNERGLPRDNIQIECGITAGSETAWAVVLYWALPSVEEAKLAKQVENA